MVGFGTSGIRFSTVVFFFSPPLCAVAILPRPDWECLPAGRRVWSPSQAKPCPLDCETRRLMATNVRVLIPTYDVHQIGHGHFNLADRGRLVQTQFWRLFYFEGHETRFRIPSVDDKVLIHLISATTDLFLDLIFLFWSQISLRHSSTRMEM